ncbi:MAG: hypothetical protein WKF59_12900 [Chitinophagaceae bacterium]
MALQIEQVFKSLGTKFKITCCYGGHLRETEENNLVQPPALIGRYPGKIGRPHTQGKYHNRYYSHIGIG